MTTQPKSNYYLVYGEVVYVEKSDPNEVKAINLNCALMTDQPYVSTNKLAEAQATLQQALHMRIQNPKDIEIKDVLIKSLNPLGAMTVDEFSGVDVLAEARKAVDDLAKATKQ